MTALCLDNKFNKKVEKFEVDLAIIQPKYQVHKGPGWKSYMSAVLVTLLQEKVKYIIISIHWDDSYFDGGEYHDHVYEGADALGAGIGP